MKYIFTISLIVLSLCATREGRCQGSWSTDSSSGFTPDGAAGSAILNGKIYIIGGSPYFQGITNTVQVFDPTTHKWTQGPDMPTTRVSLTCSALNGKIYACGGATDTGANVYTHVMEIFDSATNGWSEGPPLLIARSGHAASIVNGKLYLIGGYGIGNNIILDSVDVFDPSTNSWSSAAPIPTKRAELTSSVLAGKIYTIGGYSSDERPMDTVEIFDPVSNSWSAGPSMPLALSDCASCTLNGKIYVFGGIQETIDSRVLEIFDSATNSWSLGPDMPTGRMDLMSATVNGQIYAIGGIGNPDAVSVNEVFTPGPLGVAESEAAGSGLRVFPNPFTQSTQITFTSQSAGYAEVSIVNTLGVEVARLFSGELGAGEHSFVWNCRGALQCAPTDGVYECLVRMNGRVETLPVVLMR